MKEQRNPYPIRLSDELKDWLKQQAKINHRSYHSEIVYRLEQVMKREVGQCSN